MSKRLQVLIAPTEYKSFQIMARRAGLSLGEWVRRSLRQVAGDVSKKSAAQKMAAIRKAATYNFPTGDIHQMLAEIEKSQLDDIEKGFPSS